MEPLSIIEKYQNFCLMNMKTMFRSIDCLPRQQSRRSQGAFKAMTRDDVEVTTDKLKQSNSSIHVPLCNELPSLQSNLL